jgi:hypothetical protein
MAPLSSTELPAEAGRETAPGLRLFWVCLFLLARVPLAAQEGEGYRLLPDQVVVETPEHWRAWKAPEGVRLIRPDGSVEPRYLRRDIDAVLNAGQYEYLSEGDTLAGGIRRAGCNLAAAALAIDGDPATCWEPDRDLDVSNWWLEIDLGRVEVVQRIVVRFAAQSEGDPFLKFRVSISDGRTSLGTQNRNYYRVGLVALPNKEEREFTFPVESPDKLAAGVTGAVAQFVLVEALATDGVRGEEVAQVDHRALPATEQGAVDSFRRTVAGRQIRVEQQVYEALPAAEQGDIRYFRREHPRLAEVEVYTLGDNAVRLSRRLRVPVSDRNAASMRVIEPTDGVFRTYRPVLEYDPVRRQHQMEIDLGAQYWLDRVRMLSPLDPPPAYQIRLADGSVDAGGERVWKALAQELNRDAFLQMEVRFALQPVRFIEVRRLHLDGMEKVNANLSEVQGYGEGYVPDVVMTSPLVRLGQRRLVAGVEWEGEIPLGTRVEVRTRTGDTLVAVPHYYGATGAEVNQSSWELIAVEERRPVVSEQVPGLDWSNWSEVYYQSGEGFKSPNPRRYLLAEARLLTGVPGRAVRLRRLRLRFVPPLVEQASAELWPVQGVPLGADQAFTLYVQPVFGPGNPGFDQVHISSTTSAPLEVVEVRAGSDGELRRGQARRLWPGSLEVTLAADGGVDLVFPEAVATGNSVYAIRLRTRLFLSNTQFTVQLGHSARPGVTQQVAEGDATARVGSSSLTVIAAVGNAPLLGQIQVNPAVFTPNGDGINDQVALDAEIYGLEGAKRLQVEVWDLAGRRVRDLSVELDRPSGQHEVRWDGRDQNGARVAPGTYVVRCRVPTDAPRTGTEALRLVRVVY